MRESNHVIGIGLGFFYFLNIIGIVIASEYPARSLCCFRGLNIFFCSSCCNVCNLISIHVNIYRGGGLFYVCSGSNIGNFGSAKCSQCVSKCLRTKVVYMIIGETDNIYPKLF